MLFGELVTLRAFRSDDLAAMNAHANDVETELFSGGAPPTPRPMESTAELWERRRSDRESVDFVIEADPGLSVEDDMLRGFGREATRLAVDYAFTMRNVR